MKIVRRVVIVLLVIAIIVLYWYKQNDTDKPSQEAVASNTAPTSSAVVPDSGGTIPVSGGTVSGSNDTIPADNVTIVQAPDQTEAETPLEFAKKEFELVLPEGINVALNKKIDSSGYTQVYNAPKAVDGKVDGASYWEGKPPYPNTLTVDLENPTKIHAIRIALNPLPIWAKRTQTITINISSDGENFTELVPETEYAFDPDYGNQTQITFNETEARYVQLVVTANSGAGSAQVAEFEVYGE